MQSGTVLVFNSGSSSAKFGLYHLRAGDRLDRGMYGQIEDIEHAPRLSVEGSERGLAAATRATAGDPDATRTRAFADLLAWIRGHLGAEPLLAVGHRVVHGAARYREPVLIDDQVLADLESCVPLAPLHQGHNLAGVRALRTIDAALVQVACFDTAFHATLPMLAYRYALPAELSAAGVRRYGFHGLSYEYIASVLPQYLGAGADGRIIVAHLGNGASLCAMRERRSVATSMGFSPLEGLVMGTRPGSIDAGVLLYLMRERGMNEAALADLLYHRSGLLGVSGISHDMRALLASDDLAAAEAIDLFVYRAVSQIGALTAELGGLDALVFTAGIGEHSALLRERICAALHWLGIRLDSAANERHGPCISQRDDRCTAWVIATDEEHMIARHTVRIWRRFAAHDTVA